MASDQSTSSGDASDQSTLSGDASDQSTLSGDASDQSPLSGAFQFKLSCSDWNTPPCQMRSPSMTLFASSGIENANFVSEDFVSQGYMRDLQGGYERFIILQDSIPDGLKVVFLP
ncbi:Uncharacterized protein HZ326_26403 [Fusarium oxysporum f. sp. albedinis]|nr:Uncharacterized protein HZ326_26403 [Fusarium oxysporum f. sp. albedinis]